MSPVSRRGLFALVTGGNQPARQPFSLDRFYGERGAATGATLPTFTVRGADVPVETTRVGVTEETHGVVRIVTEECLGHSSFCSVCAERCPVEGAIVIELGRPRIVESACDGCGQCVHVCPAPRPALRFVPREPAP